MAIIEMRLPEYVCTLPISKKEIKYRPFTVKEEKILLLAQEEQNTDMMLTAMNQIFNNCTFGKVTIDSINKIDAEFLFLQLRSKSIGEGINIKGICEECSIKTPLLMDLTTAFVNGELKIEPIEIMKDVWLTMKVPSLKDSLRIKETDDILAIAMSIDTIIEGENIKHARDYTEQELVELVESLMNHQLVKLTQFYKNFPVLTIDIAYKCKCGHENKIHIEGIDNFFG